MTDNLELSQRVAELEDTLSSNKIEIDMLRFTVKKLAGTLEEIKTNLMSPPGIMMIADKSLRGLVIVERDLLEKS